MTSMKIQVNGVAIREGTSRNNVHYSANELAKFAPTLSGRPIIKDHEAKTDNTVGKVTEGQSMMNGKEVHYSGWVKEDGTNLLEKIKDGRISEVSIGAMCGKLVRESEDTDTLIAKDMTALELSLTPTPGVVGTSIAQSIDKYNEEKINNAVSTYLSVHESVSEVAKVLCKDCEMKVTPTKDGKCPDCGAKLPMGKESYSTEKSNDIIKIEKEVKMEATQEVRAENISAKDSEIAALKAKLDEAAKLVESMKQAKKEEAIASYKKLCETKKIPAKEISSMSIETVQALIDTISAIPEFKSEGTKEIAQPKSVEAKEVAKATEWIDGYVVEKSALGGFAFYKK